MLAKKDDDEEGKQTGMEEAFRQLGSLDSSSLRDNKKGETTVKIDEESKAQRTSTTWFSHYKNVPALMAKASRLLGLEGIDRWEEPQTVRYASISNYLDSIGSCAMSDSF